jgi:V8-like Glu-specific endopeptidase
MASCELSGAQSTPQALDPCLLSKDERDSIEETKKYISDGTVLYRTHDLNGCALIEIGVGPDGLVTAARVVRRKGGGESLWTFIARKFLFDKRGEAWNGLMYIDMRPPAEGE